MSETIIFGADWCRDCRRAKLVFDRAGVAYRYVDLVQEPEAAAVAKDISGRTNIPVILYPDGGHQVEPSNADMLRRIEELGLASDPAAGAQTGAAKPSAPQTGAAEPAERSFPPRSP